MGGARYQANCLPGPRKPFKRETLDLAPRAIEGAVSTSLTLSSAHVSTLGAIRHCDDFLSWTQKKKCFYKYI